MNTVDKYYELGFIHILKYLKKHNEDYFSRNCIDSASKYCHVNILDWIINSDLKIEYFGYAVDYASGKGHVEILNWLKNSGFKFKYSKTPKYMLPSSHIKILDPSRNSNFEFKYSKSAIIWASEKGHIEILDW